MAWLRWGGFNLLLLAGAMLSGLALLLPPAVVGWGDVLPVAAVFVWAPGVAATWIAYLIYAAAVVRLPPRRRARGLAAPERL